MSRRLAEMLEPKLRPLKGSLPGGQTFVASASETN